MKTCYVMNQGAVPAFADTVLTLVTPENYYDILDLYRSFPAPLALVVSATVPEGALLKFVEESACDLSVVIYYNPGLVFMSRFSRVVCKKTPALKVFPAKTSGQVLFEEVKALALA